MILALKINDLEDLFKQSFVVKADELFSDLICENCEDIINHLTGREIQHIYFGDEFCQNLILSEKQTWNILEYCEQHGLSATFLTPPVNNRGLQRLRTIFKRINKRNIEVTVNDVGVLEVLHSEFPEIKVNLGRVFDKTYHDSRFNEGDLETYCSSSGQEYFGQTAFETVGFLDMLEKYRIKLREIDYPLHGLTLNEKVLKKYALHFPYGFVTTGRVCMWSQVEKERSTKIVLNAQGCKKQCIDCNVILSKQINSIKFNNLGKRQKENWMIRKGNTLYYCNEIYEWSKVKSFQRIIIHPPFF